MATLKPSPTSPSIASSGASTSSSEIAAVSDPRRPILWWIGCGWNPGWSVSTGSGEPPVGLLRIGLGEDQRDLGVVAQRDEHLRAVDHPAGVGLAGAGALVGGIGAGVGLGQTEAPEPLARAQLRQVVLLLLARFPSAGSTSRRARSGLRSPSASRSSRDRPPRRPGRRSGNRARRRRTRGGRSPRGSPGRRSSGRARGRSVRCDRSRGRARRSRCR